MTGELGTREQLLQELEEARQESLLHRSISDNSSDYIMRYDGECRHTYANRAALEATGLSAAQFIGKTHQEMGFPAHLCELWETRIQEVFKTAQPSTIEFDVELEGGVQHLELKLHPEFDDAGGVSSVLGVSHDITERVHAERELARSEASLRSIYDQARDVLFQLQVEPDGCFRFSTVNKAFLNATGLTEEEVVGKTTAEVIPEPSHTLAIGKYRQSVREKRVVTWEETTEYPLGERIAAVAVTPTLNANGHCTHLVGSLHDLTERRAMVAELLASRDRLRGLTARLEEVREEERTAIARELHDEVGQAITAMRMDLAMMEDEIPESQEAVTHRLHSMIDLTEDALRRVHRLSHDLRSPVLDVVGLAAAIEAHTVEFGERAEVESEVEVDLKEWKTSPASDRVTVSVLLEALTNVARHAKARHVRVSVGVINEDLVLTVTDDGVGIEEHHLQDATAFGLMGMQERAKGIGGSIRIRRRDEGGTEVQAVIPPAPVPEGDLGEAMLGSPLPE